MTRFHCGKCVYLNENKNQILYEDGSIYEFVEDNIVRFVGYRTPIKLDDNIETDKIGGYLGDVCIYSDGNKLYFEC